MGNVGAVVVTAWKGRRVSVMVREYGSSRIPVAFTINEKGEEARADLTGKAQAVTGHRAFRAALDEAVAYATAQFVMQS